MDTIKTEILSIINDEGFFWLTPRILGDHKLYNQVVKNLVDENIIESVKSAGIEFRNGGYAFIKKGNPDNVHVITQNKDSWLVKGT